MQKYTVYYTCNSKEYHCTVDAQSEAESFKVVKKGLKLVKKKGTHFYTKL